MKNLIYILALSCIIISCTNMNKMDNRAAANEQRMQRFYDEVVNAHNPNMLDSFCTADFVDHNPDPGHTGKGLDELKTVFKEFFAAYPDLHFTTNAMIAKGDTVMAWITMTGTNSGPMMGHPATNKQVNVQGTDIVVIKDGKATDRWGFFDTMKMMEQLGMGPQMGGAPGDASKMEMEKK